MAAAATPPDKGAAARNRSETREERRASAAQALFSLLLHASTLIHNRRMRRNLHTTATLVRCNADARRQIRRFGFACGSSDLGASIPRAARRVIDETVQHSST